ncbi:DUF4007 family protein [Aquirhabdus parva]|uniref:DUF4007 family protein n=1 Tax=Aquirhabdus parva TaxID=2283318 RepID=A0A345P2Z5_9GAMM|nr:DUF4007 family protein [Aquirhabdus parva]AXI01654.1 DUF4007 family protein [Aquirhabdus parva]
MSNIRFPSDIKPMFSGHETFPLRQLWLRKAYSQIVQFTDKQNHCAPKTVFSAEDAIERFGVGKNMVSSIKHWALACDVIKESTEQNGFEIGEIGTLLFDEDSGVDQFLEHEASIWLVHWLLAGRSKRSATLHIIFNLIQNQTFKNEDIISIISDFTQSNKAVRSDSTVSRDVETCLKCYVSAHDTEDNIEPLLASLGLISMVGKGQYHFNRGAQHSLSDAVFGFALLDFWSRCERASNSSQTTLAFNLIAHDYSSPGRVFKLDEDAVSDRLSRISEITDNYLQWTDSSGIRQVSRIGNENMDQAKLRILRGAYV